MLAAWERSSSLVILSGGRGTRTCLQIFFLTEKFRRLPLAVLALFCWKKVWWQQNKLAQRCDLQVQPKAPNGAFYTPPACYLVGALGLEPRITPSQTEYVSQLHHAPRQNSWFPITNFERAASGIIRQFLPRSRTCHEPHMVWGASGAPCPEMKYLNF